MMPWPDTLEALNGGRVAVENPSFKGNSILISLLKVTRSALTMAASDPELLAAYKTAILKLKSMGATVVDDVEFSEWKPSSSQREELFDNIMLREGIVEGCDQRGGK